VSLTQIEDRAGGPADRGARKLPRKEPVQGQSVLCRVLHVDI